jgi:hypothetical protein
MMPKTESQTSGPKKVVYLWGAGATQAEINYLGAREINLLMRDSDELGEGVATRILKQLSRRWRTAFQTGPGIDIEKLVSLLVASNIAEHNELADNIRELYFEDICKSLGRAKVLTNPRLAIGVLTIHRDNKFRQQEILTGIITTNHDGLLQIAAQKVDNQVNLGIPFHSSDLTECGPNDSPPLLHLHGSFTWKFGLPIEVSPLSSQSRYLPETVWIPPTILKESKGYPFNKLAGMAYELLSRKCDVLRVVGSSLTQNDWNILSLIFNAQRHSELTKGSPFRIELIMQQKAGEYIRRECSYLRNLTPIGYLTDGDFEAYKDRTMDSPEMDNPLFYWIKQKIIFHRNRRELGRRLPQALDLIAGQPGDLR